MKPEKIKKEQEDSKANPISEIESKKVTAPIDNDTNELAVSKDNSALNRARTITEVAKGASGRKLDKTAKDYDNVMKLAESKGVDMNNFAQYGDDESYNKRINNAFQGAYAKELVDRAQSLSTAYKRPTPETAIKPDVKAQMELEKRKRKSKWADALYAFGEGLQGKTANKDDFVQSRIQRKQDQEFQDYKDTVTRNNKAKDAYENYNTDKMLDWLEKQQTNKNIDDKYKAQLAELAEYHKGLIAARKATTPKGKGKEEKLVKIKTAKQTYTLKPEEAAYYAREAKKKGDLIGERFPEFWAKTQKLDRFDKPIPGQFTYTLKPDITDNDLAAAYLEEQENPSFKQFEKSKESILNNYEKRGELNPKQPTKVKADPLGLGL